MTTWISVKTTVIAPNTKTAEGEKDHLGEFMDAAYGKDLHWHCEEPGGPQMATLGHEGTPLSFHGLVPLRPSIVSAAPYDLPEGEELFDELGMPLTGHLEERRLWGCKWGAFEVMSGPVRLLPTVDGARRAVTYDYLVANRYPTELWNTVSSKYIDLSFYSSWSYSERRGRSIHRYCDGYALGVRRDIMQGDDEDGERWEARLESWKKYFLDTHEHWVSEMIK